MNLRIEIQNLDSLSRPKLDKLQSKFLLLYKLFGRLYWRDFYSEMDQAEKRMRLTNEVVECWNQIPKDWKNHDSKTSIEE